MRYVRFLKPPRIAHDKNRPAAHVSCLITITSDLGDSFLPCPLSLSAELLQIQSEKGATSDPGYRSTEPETLSLSDSVITWRTVQWTEGMRSLPVTIPLSRNHKHIGPLLVRIGIEPKSTCDDLEKLLLTESRGVVSAWSAPFNLSDELPVRRTVERRFLVGNRVHRIFEETGESIARHVWDAGVMFSCQLPYLWEKSGIFNKALMRSSILEDRQPQRQELHPLDVVELGTGCGTVGIALSYLLSGGRIWLTDLPEAHEIINRNLECAGTDGKIQAITSFTELDWDVPLDQSELTQNVDLIIAADCTYNADSSPAFVRTIRHLAEVSPHVTIIIAMKRRHESEDVFFDLMSKANFRNVNTICFPLPGDENPGEESVELYVYEYLTSTQNDRTVEIKSKESTNV